MAAGGPGDHPISDILHWKLEVYGPEPDREFRELAAFLSPREPEEWWRQSIGWNAHPDEAAKAIREQFQWAVDRATDSGWEGV